MSGRSPFSMLLLSMNTPIILDLQQIYCTVREPVTEGASTPLPEVTAFSDGLTAAGAARIASQCGLPFNIPPELKLTPEMTDANPYVVYDYAPRLTLREVTAEDGSKKWVIVRSIYLGDMTLTHIFVSDVSLGPEVFAAIERDGLWRPSEYSLNDANGDLNGMLNGIPATLSVVSLTIDPVPMTVVSEYYELTLLLPVLAESMRRRKGLSQGSPVIAAYASIGRIQSVVSVLGALPASVTAGVSITTGYRKGNADNDIDLILTSDQSPDAPSDALTVNLIDGSDNGISDRYTYEMALRLIGETDFVSASALIDWWVNTKITADERFETDMFIALHTSRPIDRSTLTPEFVRKSLCSCSNDAEKELLTSKLLFEIDKLIGESSKSSALLAGIDAAGAMEEVSPGSVKISDESVDRLSRLLFRRGSTGYLGKMLKGSNVRAVLSLLSPDKMGTHGQLMAALALSRDPEVWISLLNHYYQGDPARAFDEIMAAVTTSAMTVDDRSLAITSLFPLAERATQLIEWYKLNPRSIAAVPGPLRAICLSVHDECFSRLLSGPGASEACRAVAPVIEEYFKPKIEASPDAGMKQLLGMIRRLRPDLLSLLSLIPLIELYTDKTWRSPGENSSELAAYICRSGVLLPDNLMIRLKVISAVLSGQLPGCPLTVDHLEFAARVRKTDVVLREKMFRKWTEGAPSLDLLSEYLRKISESDPAVIEPMIMTVWQAPKCADLRNAYIHAIIDGVSWDSDERLAFVSEISDSELQEALGYKKSLFSKLGRMFKR